MSLDQLTNVRYLLTWLTQLADQIPVYEFAFIGSILEEIIVIIPSPFVMLTIGLNMSGGPPHILTIISVILLGALGKTLGASCFYYIADKGEDVVLGKLGRYIGISHTQVEKIGSVITKRGNTNTIFFLLRAFPLMPSTPVSVFAGMVKFPPKLFFLLTYLGFVIRDAIILAIGYLSPEGIDQTLNLLETLDSAFKYGLIFITLIGVYLLYKKRGQLFGAEDLPTIRRQDHRYLTQFEGIDFDRVGTLLSNGLHHRVYAYGDSHVIKIPRRPFYFLFSHKHHLDRDYMLLTRYFPDSTIPTEFILSRDKKHYLIIQEHTKGSLLTTHMSMEQRTALTHMLLVNSELKHKHHMSLDLLGQAGVTSITKHIWSRRLPYMSNIIWSPGDSTCQPTIKIIDTELLRLHPVDQTLQEYLSTTLSLLSYVVSRVILKLWYRLSM